jgi:hypothetical protein
MICSCLMKPLVNLALLNCLSKGDSILGVTCRKVLCLRDLTGFSPLAPRPSHTLPDKSIVNRAR